MATEKQLPLICIIDDERSIGRALMRLFRRLDVRVEAFVDPIEALAWLGKNPVDVIITDQRMPGMSGTELLAALGEEQANATRFILSGYSDFEEITAAFNQGGIHKYISKPWNDEELLFTVESVLSSTSEEFDLPLELKPRAGVRPQRMLGADPAMVKLFEQVRRMATANVPVFIHGETGTGKELVARALHEESFRADKPFIAVNCANFSAELMESQLFGHKKGAFTGADKDRTGLLEAANGGTLFLDEVTTLPMALQSRLLRVLQEREYTPLGSNQVISFDAQVLSASSQRLATAVEDGSFREDLRYRLEVLPLDLPALRQRGRDALVLFDHYLAEVREDIRFDFSREFSTFLERYSWPGNVRQLINIANYVATMSDSSNLDLGCLPADVREAYLLSAAGSGQGVSRLSQVSSQRAPAGDSAEVKPMWQLEREAIEAALRACDDNIPRAAAMLELSPSTIYRKMQGWSETAA
jgi:two-component system repressor protein LuxO